MSLIKKVLIAIGIVFILFIVVQFIQPVHNKSDELLASDISKTITISDNVRALIINACYDCHSNNTSYPWYSNIQPMGWLMAKHIKNGKDELNFSEFGSYSARKQLSKFNGIANSIRDDIMPLRSYKLMHKNSRLSTTQMELVINWAQQSIESLSSK